MDIKSKIIEIVREFAENVPDETGINLVERGIIDSMMIMNLLTSLEDEFDFETEVKDISRTNFESIDKMAEMVNRYINK
ncbi:MAG: hypothetical protein J6A73_03955 [Lachnospiraceae bacterium]|nr:hypothetical protein [Lachnospiraceae bacterium]